VRKKLVSLIAIFSILFLSNNIEAAFSAAPSGLDFAYDKESSVSNNKVWGSLQAIPAGASDPVTVETWLNIESFTSDWMTIFSMNQGDSCCSNRLWFGINGPGKYFHTGTQATTLDSPNVQTEIPLGTWTHVALTLGATGANNLKIYISGDLFYQGNLTRASSTNINGNGFAIGTSTSGGYRFDGRFDNFKIWNTVLTQTQIRESRYAYGTEGVSGAPSLRAYYDFDEGSGTDVYDRSGNDYNLTISNPVGNTDTFIGSTRQKAISYDNQGATTSQSGGSTTFNNGSAILAIPTTAPQRTSFNFAGWFTSPTTGTQIINGSSMPNTREATVTLYARWTDALSPVYSSASVGSSGTSISLSYNETLSATTAASSRFTITANGNSISVSSVATSSGTVSLTLASTIFAGQTVLLSYADPTGSDDANAIQDLAGNDAASLISQVVTNSSSQKQNQTITFNTISDKTFGDAAFTLSASDTTTSGLAISYTIDPTTSAACQISSRTVTILRAGICTINANQIGNSNFNAASQVQRSFNIARASQSVFSLSSTAGTFLTNLQLTTSGGTDTGTVSFTVSATGTANCSIINSESLTSTSAGNCQVVATKLGTTNYLTATDTRTVTIGKASITFVASAAASLKYGATTSVTYTTSRSLGVGSVPNLTGTLSFETSTSTACTVNSATGLATMRNSSGSCNVRVSLVNDTNFSDTSSALVSITPAKADTLTVTTATPAALTYTGSPAAVAPTVNVSGLVAGDTATGATFNFRRTPTCAQGGTCQVGDTGPGGGKVFYVSGSAINAAPGISTGGVYLEMAPATFSESMYNWCGGSANSNRTLIGASGTVIGTGASNTKIMIDNCSGGAGFEAVNLTFGGQSDWFLPSFAELQVIYELRNSLGLGATDPASGFLYWSSTESDYLVAGSLVPWSGVGGYNKEEESRYLPIRAFSATVSVYSASATAPTNAGSYVITPSALTLAGGITTDYYKATVYETATLSISKATQVAFTSYQTLVGIFGTAFNIYKYGGSGDGEETLTVTNGTAAGCVLNGTILTAVTAGTCVVTATKATSENYLESASTFTVILSYFVPETAVPVSNTPTQIAVSISNSWSINPSISPTITGISPNSGPVGTEVTITGIGMDGVDVIKIGRRNLTSVTGINSTSVRGVIPEGAVTGPILVSNSMGSHFVASGFAVTP
jgi:hypothetical protein